MQQNNYPKLHNATWPGIVGKGTDSEPPVSLDQLLEFTTSASVDGVKFDGIDIGLFDLGVVKDAKHQMLRACSPRVRESHRRKKVLQTKIEVIIDAAIPASKVTAKPFTEPVPYW